MISTKDPFSLTLEKLVMDVQSLMIAVGIPRKERESFNELRGFKHRYEMQLEADSLSFAVDNFETFERNLQETLAIFEKGFLKYEALNDKPSVYIANADAIKKTLANAKAMYDAFTPTHLALQAHCYNFASLAPQGVWVSIRSTQRMFTPLYELRDEYFSYAQAVKLDEYLTNVEKIMVDPLHEDVVAAELGKLRCDEALAKAKELALELEIMLLMDSITEDYTDVE